MTTVFQHYKGDIYEWLHRGTHTETGEVFIVYRDITGKVWIRPKDMFYELVELEDGRVVERFTHLGDFTS